jgi:hypothetical protein
MNCRDFELEERDLRSAIKAIIAETASQQASPEVESTLLAAFRQHFEQADAQVVNLAPRPWLWRRSRIVAACAAVFTVAVLTGSAWWIWNSHQQKHATSQLSSSLDPKVAGPVSAPATPAQHLPRRKTPRRVRRPIVIENEIAARFYPLIGQDEASLESGRVVTVEVPVSTLIAMGMPVSTTDINRSIHAELLIGQDGLARAIRLPQ